MDNKITYELVLKLIYEYKLSLGAIGAMNTLIAGSKESYTLDEIVSFASDSEAETLLVLTELCEKGLLQKKDNVYIVKEVK